VTTGDAGSSASATITGTAPSQTLNLTIPQGNVGATGSTGPTGATGAAATITVNSTTTGAAGSNASVTNSGTTSAAKLDFTIPRGNTGATGSAATISVGTTSNLAPGADATVSNSGTTSAAIFDFGIPQGAVWYTGSSAPSTTHNDGDLYLNTSNGDVYKQVSGSWGSSIANLTGPTGSAGSASGSDTQVQFNDGGSFAGDAGLTYNKTTNALTASGGFVGNADTATKLKTARTIGGVSFDGSANISLPGVNTTGTQDTSGNAATATKLATARDINGVAFDGSAAITITDDTKQPAMIPVTVTTAYNTATKVGTTDSGTYSPSAGDILYVNFTAGCAVSSPTLNIDGSGAKNIRVGTANVTTTYLNATSGIYLPLFYDGTYYQLYGSRENTNTTYAAMSVAEGEAGTATTSRTVRADYLQTIINYYVDQALTTMNADVSYGWL